MNYIGSKLSLLPEIERILDENGIKPTGTALDLFAGTSVVAQFLKKRGHTVYANDWQRYSYLTSVAYIECGSMPEFAGLFKDKYWAKVIKSSPPIAFQIRSINGRNTTSIDSPASKVLSHLSQLCGKTGEFHATYCEGGQAGRLYFSEENGLRIQAIRDQIEHWHSEGLINERENAWLVACLIEGADQAANTASVYGAYLKRVKTKAQKPLQLYALDPVPSTNLESEHKAFCEDGETLLRQLSSTRLQLVYIDPPYNARQYNANYHILETIARWDMGSFEPKGITGLRKHTVNRSSYCSKAKAEQSFRTLLAAANAEYVLFSYNNEGLVGKESLQAMFEEYCSEVIFEAIQYKRFRADNDGENRVYKGNSTVEYLILGKKREFDGWIV